MKKLSFLMVGIIISGSLYAMEDLTQSISEIKDDLNEWVIEEVEPYAPMGIKYKKTVKQRFILPFVKKLFLKTTGNIFAQGMTKQEYKDEGIQENVFDIEVIKKIFYADQPEPSINIKMETNCITVETIDAGFKEENGENNNWVTYNVVMPRETHYAVETKMGTQQGVNIMPWDYKSLERIKTE